MKPLDGGHRTVQNSQWDTVVENLEKPPSSESILERSMVGMRWGPGRESGLRSERAGLGEVNNKTGDGGCRSRPLEMSGFITSRPNLI
jgi:hypothetical protein